MVCFVSAFTPDAADGEDPPLPQADMVAKPMVLMTSNEILRMSDNLLSWQSLDESRSSLRRSFVCAYTIF